MTAFIYISPVIMLAAVSLSVKYFLHMFQLNSYAKATQLLWYRRNIKKPAKIFIALPVAVLVVSLVFPLLEEKAAPGWSMLFVSLLAILISLSCIEHNSKKKLVFTMRVKRLCATIYIIELALLIVMTLWAALGAEHFTAIHAALFAAAYAAIFAWIPILVPVADIINKPMEKAVNNHYIKEAKRLLNSHETLITVGITGSYGKTSVKYYLATLLKAKYNVLMTPESYNTPLGIVRTIRGELKPYHEIFVCEMGAKKLGEIKEICDLFPPKHGIITSVGPQHLETFKSLDNVKKTKFELADALPADGMLLVNGNDENIKAYNYNRDMLTYGVTPDCDYYAYDISVSSKGTSFKVKSGDEECEFKTELVGRHNVINVVGAIAMSHRLGISLNELRPQVRRLKCVPHRLELVSKGDVTIIDDAYNSNPSGAKAALDTLALFGGTKILITPGMVELGTKQEECNREFGRQASKVCDYIFLVGVNQTKPIYEGIIEAGFDVNKVSAYDSLNEALEKMYALDTKEQKIVLLENDLPDNY